MAAVRLADEDDLPEAPDAEEDGDLTGGIRITDTLRAAVVAAAALFGWSPAGPAVDVLATDVRIRQLPPRSRRRADAWAAAMRRPSWGLGRRFHILDGFHRECGNAVKTQLAACRTRICFRATCGCGRTSTAR
jgi:hypothetical protein